MCPYLCKGQIFASTKKWVRSVEEWFNLFLDCSNPLFALGLFLLVTLCTEHAKHVAANLGVPCVDEEINTSAEQRRFCAGVARWKEM